MRLSCTAVNAAVALAATVTLSSCSGASSSSFAPSVSTQQSSAQSRSNVRSNGDDTPYYLVTLDSLGGSVSFAININDSGQASGTSLLAGNSILHAQIWPYHSRRTRDLGTLGGPNSAVFQYNHGRAGQFVGWSETASYDPNDENFCGFGTSHVCLGFSWQHGKMRSLPTLGGNNDNANDVNERGQISGAAETSTKDYTCSPPHVLDYLGVIWQPDGKMTTLPPYYGDTVSYAYTMDQSGKNAVGNSGTCAAPATHAVLWQNASSPVNLGTLGGSVNIALDINNRGQIIGNSDLYGNTVTHTFLWQNGTMSDLGTLSGDLNSFAGGINDEGQVVGQSCDASGNCRGYLWQDGSIYDLNALISPHQNLNVLFGANINDGGQIVGATVNTSGLERAVVLIPRDRARALHRVPAYTISQPQGRRIQLPTSHTRFWDLRDRSVIPR